MAIVRRSLHSSAPAEHDDSTAQAREHEEHVSPRRALRKRLRSARTARTLGIISDITLIVALILLSFVAYQVWWTGVESSRAQNNDSHVISSSWTQPETTQDGKTKIAPEHSADISTPVESQPQEQGALIGQIYVPRFGKTWVRSIVEGTSLAQLNKHGYGHYSDSVMAGAVGLSSYAGHRAGYGQPGALIPTLQEGDLIIIRTHSYWYIYKYTHQVTVTPDKVEAIAQNPDDPSKAPTKRLIALTTCDPPYAQATHRIVAYGELMSWAKVSEGTPKSLVDDATTHSVTFSSALDNVTHVSSHVIPQRGITVALLIGLFVILYLIFGFVTRFAFMANDDYKGLDTAGKISHSTLMGQLNRLMVGNKPMRITLWVVLALTVVFVLITFVSPLMAQYIPFLRDMSANNVTLG